MQSSTGKLGYFETEEEAKAKGFDIPLTEVQFDSLSKIPEDERVAQLAFDAHLENLPKMETITKLHYRRGFIAGFNANKRQL